MHEGPVGGGAGRVPRGSARQRLIEAATHLFSEQGFQATSVQQIVDAAHVTKGALYHHWRSKDELIFDVYDELLQLQTDHLEQIATGGGSSLARLRAAAEDVVETSAEYEVEASAFVNAMHYLASEQARAVRARRRRYHERFCDLLQEAQSEGLLRGDVSADVAVQGFLSALTAVGTWRRPDGSLTFREIGHQMVELFMSSLLPREA